MQENLGKDVVTHERIREGYEILKGSKEPGIDLPNPWILNVNADEEWWKGLPVGNVTITGGGNELWKDDILTVGGRIKVREMRQMEKR